MQLPPPWATENLSEQKQHGSFICRICWTFSCRKKTPYPDKKCSQTLLKMSGSGFYFYHSCVNTDFFLKSALMLISIAERRNDKGTMYRTRSYTCDGNDFVMVMISCFHLQTRRSFLYLSFAFSEVFIMSDCRVVTMSVCDCPFHLH